jgi:antitoxin component HigA of HigAB toxin-antitoxin module
MLTQRGVKERHLRFEESRYALAHAEPVEALRVMDDGGARPWAADLIPVFGAGNVVSDVFNGKRSRPAHRLAEFFRVPVSLFI